MWKGVLEIRDQNKEEILLRSISHCSELNCYLVLFISLLYLFSLCEVIILAVYAVVDHMHSIFTMDQSSYGKEALSMFMDYGNKWRVASLKEQNFCDGAYETCRTKECIFVHKLKADKGEQ